MVNLPDDQVTLKSPNNLNLNDFDNPVICRKTNNQSSLRKSCFGEQCVRAP